MTLEDFKNTLQETEPSEKLPAELQAMWYAGKGEWDKSHDICQETNLELDWVHAWLHRQEGDLPNAQYWYRRANRTMSENSLEVEWDEISAVLLKAASET